ncbi:hypothetical protein YTPLAS18_17080 [Nitrospira sp.]|nr:hypothetical protein YTPLAS18_17080 [Nitrospira sp.]
MGTATPTTIGEALTLYQELHVSNLRHPKPVRTRIALYFPSLLDRRIDELSAVEVARWHQANRERSQQQANASLVILRALYKWLLAMDLYKGTCPALAVKIKRPLPRQRFLDTEELTRVLRVLAHVPLIYRVYFSLMLFTGCRPGEAAVMQWKDLKFWTDSTTGSVMGTWTKPQTKNGLPHRVPLPPAIVSLLQEHRKDVLDACPWVFPGRNKVVCKAWWHAAWWQIRNAAGIPDVRIHDLRRSCATHLLANGTDLNTISKGVLNHRDLATTAIYAVPLDAGVREALTKNAERMLAAAFGTPDGGGPHPKLTLVPTEAPNDTATNYGRERTANYGA